VTGYALALQRFHISHRLAEQILVVVLVAHGW
jgi:hypothetical protein